MSSPAQIASNRLNAQLSTGPRSEAGKDKVSRNALAHGLAAKQLFLSPDEKPAFDELRETFAEHYKPATAHERRLVDELTETTWRRRTARIMENSFLGIAIADQQKADPGLTTQRALAQVFIDEAIQKRMRLMMRYLSAAERAVDKARRELELVIAARVAAEQSRAELQAFMAIHAPLPAPPPSPSAPDAVNRVCSELPQRL